MSIWHTLRRRNDKGEIIFEYEAELTPDVHRDEVTVVEVLMDGTDILTSHDPLLKALGKAFAECAEADNDFIAEAQMQERERQRENTRRYYSQALFAAAQ